MEVTALSSTKIGDRVKIIGYMDHDSRIKAGVVGEVVDLSRCWPGIKIDNGDEIHVPLYNLMAA